MKLNNFSQIKPRSFSSPGCLCLWRFFHFHAVCGLHQLSRRFTPTTSLLHWKTETTPDRRLNPVLLLELSNHIAFLQATP